MDLTPETRSSLLIEFSVPANQRAWLMSMDIYRPHVDRLARTRKLQHTDANDLLTRMKPGRESGRTRSRISIDAESRE